MITANVLYIDLYRMEGGLLTGPDMKDRLTLSIYWKKLKICNTSSHVICIHRIICMQMSKPTCVVLPQEIYACSSIVFVTKLLNTLIFLIVDMCTMFISSCTTSNRWVHTCLPTNTLHSSSIVYVAMSLQEIYKLLLWCCNTQPAIPIPHTRWAIFSHNIIE